MNVTATLTKYGLTQAFKYLYKDPEANLEKLIDWADSLAGDHFPAQRAVLRRAFTDPNDPYHDYVLHVIHDVEPAEYQCPGVWYVASKGSGRFANEYYIVERSSPSISAAAKEYGLPLPHHTDLLAYHLEHPQGGRSVVAYEVARWCVRNGKPTPDGETLLTTAAYAMENNPEYFGNFPAPIHTPRGAMTRYKPIINGVFALETDQGKRMIAVCYPLWSAAPSGYTMSVAEQTEYDLAHGIDTTLGYLFFAEEHGCLALFELLEEFPEILSSPLIAAAALGNAIWHNQPDYAVVYNRDEQNGLHDCLAALLRALGAEEVEPNISVDHLIRLTTGVGTDYIRL